MRCDSPLVVPVHGGHCFPYLLSCSCPARAELRREHPIPATQRSARVYSQVKLRPRRHL